MPGHFRNGYSNGQQALNSVQVQEGFCHVLVMAGRLMINSCALSCLLINRPSAKAPFFMCIFVHFLFVRSLFMFLFFVGILWHFSEFARSSFFCCTFLMISFEFASTS